MDSGIIGGISKMCNYSDYILEKGRVLEYISIRHDDGWDDARIQKGLEEKFHLSEYDAKELIKEASLESV